VLTFFSPDFPILLLGNTSIQEKCITRFQITGGMVVYRGRRRGGGVGAPPLFGSISPCAYSCHLTPCVCPPTFQLAPTFLYPTVSTIIDLGTTRPPLSIGSCVEAGFSFCCSSFLPTQFCVGSAPHNCFCDVQCVQRGDCCPDIADSCPSKFMKLHDISQVFLFFRGSKDIDGCSLPPLLSLLLVQTCKPFPVDG
jgi:hypothetical protein